MVDPQSGHSPSVRRPASTSERMEGIGGNRGRVTTAVGSSLTRIVGGFSHKPRPTELKVKTTVTDADNGDFGTRMPSVRRPSAPLVRGSGPPEEVEDRHRHGDERSRDAREEEPHEEGIGREDGDGEEHEGEHHEPDGEPTDAGGGDEGDGHVHVGCPGGFTLGDRPAQRSRRAAMADGIAGSSP